MIFLLFVFWLCHSSCGLLVPQSGIEPTPPVLEEWSLDQWTVREVHNIVFNACVIFHQMEEAQFFREILCGNKNICRKKTA